MPGLVSAFDVAVNYAWSISIEGITFAEITQVGGVKMESDVVEYKANTIAGLYIHRKLPARMKSGTLTLTRAAYGIDEGKAFVEWMTGVWGGQFLGGATAKDVHLSLNDFTALGKQKFTAWQCVPASIDYGTWKAGDANVMNEVITLHHCGLYPGSNAATYMF